MASKHRTALGSLPTAVNAQVGQSPTARRSAAPGQENAPVTLSVGKPTGKPASKKRKSAEEHAPAAEVTWDSFDLDGEPVDENCDQVRRKINNFIASGMMTKTAFARQIGVSAKSLNGFLGTHGPDNGVGFVSYRAAWEFFKKLELAGVDLDLRTPKKRKVSAAGEGSQNRAGGPAAVDLSDIELPGEESDEVPIFESCDEIRKKMNAYLKKPGATKAQLGRDIYAQLKGPCRPAKVFQSSQLDNFRGRKGALAGAKTAIFYGAYVFFEKLRIKEGKPKSKHRREMEELWEPDGMPRDMDQNQRVLCHVSQRPYVDQYGRFSVF